MEDATKRKHWKNLRRLSRLIVSRLSADPATLTNDQYLGVLGDVLGDAEKVVQAVDKAWS